MNVNNFLPWVSQDTPVIHSHAGPNLVGARVGFEKFLKQIIQDFFVISLFVPGFVKIQACYLINPFSQVQEDTSRHDECHKGEVRGGLTL